jgi:small subunit ribosomal protein S5
MPETPDQKIVEQTVVPNSTIEKAPVDATPAAADAAAPAAPTAPTAPAGRGDHRGGPGGGRGGQGGRGGGRGRGPGGNRGPRGRGDENKSDLLEKVVFINRCAKVVKGGRRFSFSALLVVGDRKGKVGIGFGKALEVTEAIRKATDVARKHLEPVSLKGPTIPHEVLAKSLGSGNPANVVKATLDALKQLRPKEAIFQLRGKTMKTPEAAPATPEGSAPNAEPLAKPGKGKGKSAKATKPELTDTDPALAS